MAYRIKPHKSASKEVRRIALQRLEKARKALLLPAEQRAHGIHQARKRLKEIRALARLVRKPLGDCFKQENRRFRDINRELSDMRDAGALIETWDQLASLNPDRFAEQDMQAVRKRLVIRGQDGGQTLGESHLILGKVDADLAEAQEAIAAWPLASKKGFALFAQGLQRSVEEGRKDLDIARDSPTDDHLHDWRKRVKDHWYHTRLLENAWPAIFKLRAAMLKELSELLGQDHDLSMLQTLLEQEPALFGSASQRKELEQIAGQRRDWLQHEAFKLGQWLYAEKPKALRKRWSRYWELAREEKKISRKHSKVH